MTTAQIVGLGGYLRSGKDTVADYLVEHHGYVKTFMSKPLLDMALVLDPLIPITPSRNLLGEMVYAVRFSVLVDRVGYTGAKENPEVRRFLQVLGTDVGRNMISQNLWTDIAVKNMREILATDHKVVITGIRFPNEVEMVQRLNRTVTDAELVWVDRPSLQQPSGATHASENSVSAEDFDTVLTNDGSLDDLYRTVDEWIKA